MPGGVGRLAAVIGRHPREFVGGIMATAAMLTIFINAVFLQKGPHPAPIFAPRSSMTQEAPVVAPRAPAAQSNPAPDTTAQSRALLIANIQRELSRKGFYDGPADGVWGGKTDTAARDFVQACAGAKINPEASDGLLRAIVTSGAKVRAVSPEPVRNDPIAELIAPSKRGKAGDPTRLGRFRRRPNQADGQLRPRDANGDREIRARSCRLPVTGQISDRFVRELAAMTGFAVGMSGATPSRATDIHALEIRHSGPFAAYVRRCPYRGAFAAVRRHGAEEAGAVYIKVNRLDGTGILYGPAPQSAFDDAQVPATRLFTAVVGRARRQRPKPTSRRVWCAKSATTRTSGSSRSRIAPGGIFSTTHLFERILKRPADFVAAKAARRGRA